MINRNILSQNKENTTLKNHFFTVVLLICFLLVLITPQIASAQTLKDSIRINSHSPRKASLYSMVLPGMGQVYNHQIWKVPVLYAGIATLTYFFIFNTNKYNTYRNEFVARSASDSSNFNPSYSIYSDNTILLLKNFYQRNLEFTYIVAGLVYLLNIVDASVYAHLFTFDVGNDLSLRIDPLINNNFLRSGSPPTAGLKLTLHF